MWNNLVHVHIYPMGCPNRQTLVTTSESLLFSHPWREKGVSRESVCGSLYRARDSTDGGRSFQKTRLILRINIKVANGGYNHDT